MKKNLWIISFLFLLLLFFHKIVLQGLVIGPFDFLVGFYDPFREIQWGSEALQRASRHYKNYLMSDVVVVVLPVKIFAMELLRDFQIPLWNPYILNGSPLLANIQSAVFYPFNILYFIFDYATAFNIYIISQLLLAFIFMYLFLRSLTLDKYSSYFGAMAFSCSSYFIVWLPWGTLGHAFLWLPLALYAINKYFLLQEKKYGFLLVLSLVLSFFAGHTQTTLVVYAISLSYLLLTQYKTKAQKPFLTISALYIVVFLLICIQLVPTIEMHRESVRDIVSTSDFYKDQTLNFSSYLMAVAPDFFGSPVTRNWWGKANYAESAVYFGIVALYFAIFAILKRKVFDRFLFLFLVSLLLVGILASTRNPLSWLLFKLHLPLASSSAFSRYSMIFIFAGSVLSALGVSAFLKTIKKGDFRATYANSACFVLALALLWTLIFTKSLPPLYLSNLTILKRNLLLPTALILTTISIVLILIVVSRRLPKYRSKLAHLAPVLFILLLSVELLRFGYKYTPFSPRAFFFPHHALIEKLALLANEDRYSGYFPTNTNTYYGAAGIGGGDPLYNKRMAEVAMLGKGVGADIRDRAGMEIADGPHKERVLDLLSVRYFVDKTDNFRNSWVRDHGGRHDLFDGKFKTVWENDLFKILENTQAVPHHQLVYNIEYYPQEKKALARLISKDFDPRKTAIIDKNLPPFSSSGKYTIKSLRRGASLQEYEVRTMAPALLTVTDTYYPGWKVYVDRQEQEIIRVNHSFRGVAVPAGSHTVRFVYMPHSFIIGSILSFVGGVALLLFIFI